MSFCTAINCIDGRTQRPVSDYLMRRFGAKYVDTVTEAGPVRHLASEPASETTRSIFSRVDISVEKHGSSGIALVAHHDCAGNPVTEERQKAQLATAVDLLRKQYPGTEVIGLWVGSNWQVSEA